jgi:hypothetical protein
MDQIREDEGIYLSHYKHSLSPGYREVVEAYPAAIINTASVLDTGRMWKPNLQPL